jgi:hypothetical protein
MMPSVILIHSFVRRRPIMGNSDDHGNTGSDSAKLD